MHRGKRNQESLTHYYLKLQKGYHNSKPSVTLYFCCLFSLLNLLLSHEPLRIYWVTSLSDSLPMVSTASLAGGTGLGLRLPICTGVAARDKGADLKEERDVRLLPTSLAVEAATTSGLVVGVRVTPD